MLVSSSLCQRCTPLPPLSLSPKRQTLFCGEPFIGFLSFFTAAGFFPEREDPTFHGKLNTSPAPPPIRLLYKESGFGFGRERRMSIRRPSALRRSLGREIAARASKHRLSTLGSPLWVFTLTLPAPEAEGGRRAHQITQKVSFPSTSSFFPLFCSDCLLLLPPLPPRVLNALASCCMAWVGVKIDSAQPPRFSFLSRLQI